MRICIYGAGSIGAYIGSELSLSGADVTLIARGQHFEAMRSKGLRVRIGSEEKISYPKCVSNPDEAGKQDYVFITLKTHSSAKSANSLAPLIDSDTCVVTAQNGIPWWYFYNLNGPWKNYQVKSVDPDGNQWTKIGPERVIGSVIYPAAEIVEPGVIALLPHLSQKRMPIGEPNGDNSKRVIELSKALISAGFKSPIRKDIRSDIWMKLWGNLAFNPISALTHASLKDIAGNPGTRSVARIMMLEGMAVAEKLGVKFNIDIDQRIAGAESVGHHRTSMLQDLILERPMEIDALVGSISEIGKLVSIPTPMIDTIYSLIKQRSENLAVTKSI